MSNATFSHDELVEWAAAQPIRFELVDGRLHRQPEQHQGEARLAFARGIARRAFGCDGTAETWLTTPSAELGGLSPADLVSQGDEGSRLALLALVRRHRRDLATGSD